MKKQLTDKTLVPIGLAVTVIGGGAIWLTKIYMTVDAHSKTLTEIRQVMGIDRRDLEGDVKSIHDLLFQMDRRLSGIEGELKRIRR